MLIKDLISKEAQDILNRSHRKQMLLDAEDLLRIKTEIALAKMQRAKEKGTYPKKEGR